jgi:hypothetical protein
MALPRRAHAFALETAASWLLVIPFNIANPLTQAFDRAGSGISPGGTSFFLPLFSTAFAGGGGQGVLSGRVLTGDWYRGRRDLSPFGP